MKKVKRIIGLCLIMLLSMTLANALAQADIKVMLNDEYIEFDVQPRLINDRTMVPLRAIFEALGAEVEWNGDTQTVSAIRDDTVVVAIIGDNSMFINDEEKIMDVAPMIIDGRTLVPVRFVAEAFGCDVEWDEDTFTVVIKDESVTNFISELPIEIINGQYE